MEEIDLHTEKVIDDINEEAEHAHERWISWVALSTALLAVGAAVSSLLAGDHVNEALIEQIQASDQWGYYQAKKNRRVELETRIELLTALGHEPPEKHLSKRDDYVVDEETIKAAAEEKEASARVHLQRHVVFARSVTMFQVAIAVSAISILTKRRSFWYVGLGGGLLGLLFLVQGLLG